MTATTGSGAHAASASSVAGRDGRDGGGERSNLGELFSSVTADLSTLVRQEIALAKAEVTQSATKAAGLLAGAGVSGHFVLLFLSIALWWGLGGATGRGWSALIVAAVWAIIAAVLAAVGRKQLKTVQGLPATTESLGKVPAALKGHEEENHR